MTSLTVRALAGAAAPRDIFDELSKRSVRRAILTAIAVPGYQVPFSSREMPVARGWGSGGLQATLALVGEDDTVKVIDQGEDAGVNAANLRRLIVDSAGCAEQTDTSRADVIQSRHRVPEQPLRRGQILVLQVPVPEPLRGVVASMDEQRRMHAEADYAKVWVRLYEDIVRNGLVSHSADYPCLVNGRYVIAPSPIPRFDVPKLNDGEALVVLSAGREKRIYAIPPHTRVEPLTFEDVPFVVEHTEGARCAHCGSEDTYLIGVPEEDGGTRWVCSDTDWCSRHRDNSSNPANPDNGAVRAVAAGTEGRVA
ncbi:MAG TPA: alpha-D-ribose 1-methylphosphonate 5-phosphate C-P-lyase PhnJ [Pseudonocardiaceae bacterium]